MNVKTFEDGNKQKKKLKTSKQPQGTLKLKKISIVISEKQKSIQSSSSSIGYRIEL